MRRKCKVPRHSFHPDWEEAGLSWQLLRVTSTQLSLLREPGGQETAGPQVPQAAHTVGAGPSDCIIPGRLLSLGCQGGDGGEVHCHFKTWTWPMSSHDEGSGALQVPACSLGTPSSPSGTGRVSRRALRRKAGSNSYLALRLRTTIPLTVGWIANKGRPLTAGHLGEGHTAAPTVAHCGEGPTTAPTNSWAGALTVLIWQLLTWGRGPPQHQPIAEQVH